MKRTARLITSIAAIVLTIVIMCVGIFAAKKVSLTSNNPTLSFTATDIAATVTGKTQMDNQAATTLTLPDGGVFAPTINQGQDYVPTQTITLDNITFERVDSNYVITLTIQNDFDSVAIGATYTVTCAGDTNGYIVTSTTTKLADAPESEEPAAYTSGTQYTLAGGKTVTFQTTISIINDVPKRNTILENGFSGITFKFALDMARVTPVGA